MRTGEKEKQRKRARRAKTESESGNVDEGAGGATGGTSGPRDKVARHTALLGESRLRPDHISCRRFSRPVQTRASEPTHSYSPRNLSTESRTVISPPLPPPPSPATPSTGLSLLPSSKQNFQNHVGEGSRTPLIHIHKRRKRLGYSRHHLILSSSVPFRISIYYSS